MTDDEIEKYKLNMRFSNASNSQPPVDFADRARWNFNTPQAALLGSSKIPPGYYGGVPINMPTSGAGGCCAPKWSELSGAQRRDGVIAFVIAFFFRRGPVGFRGQRNDLDMGLRCIALRFDAGVRIELFSTSRDR